MTGQATPPELPAGLREEYIAGMRATLGELLGLAERLARAGNDRDALDALRREAHKIRGSAGSYGFMDASRFAAGMEVTLKDWAARPDDPEVDRGSLARWFVQRLAEMLGLPVPTQARPPRPAHPPARPLPQPPVVAPRTPQSHTPAAPSPPTPAAARQVPGAVPRLAPVPVSRPDPEPTLPASQPPQPPSPSPLTSATPAGSDVPEVIFVEDDAALAELLEYGLRARGYRFAAYRNGREALRELLALDVRGSHPLLLLDVDLPALDGYSMFDALQRERPGTYRVVFTTVHGAEDEQLRGLEAGALDYLVKPISLRVALEKIKRWVGR